jgi:hypothetical protein
VTQLIPAARHSHGHSLTTLDYVRALIERHLPAHIRNKPTWRCVCKKLAEASRGAATQWTLLYLDGVECQPK